MPGTAQSGPTQVARAARIPARAAARAAHPQDGHGDPHSSRSPSLITELRAAPVAAFLTKVTGQRVTYQHSDNWLSYQSEMQKDAYDLIFDGPHFVGWRMAKHQHTPLVKLPGNLSFAVIVRAKETRIENIESLAGHTVCAHAPPNLATLSLLAQFTNPSRQPLVIEVKGFKAAYHWEYCCETSGASPSEGRRSTQPISNSARTGAWSDGRSAARGRLSIRADRQTAHSAALARIWSMRNPRLRRNAAMR